MEKFLCDAMCAELGKWLRAAGYDTEIVESPLQDKAIYEKALLEKRVLITRDKHFKELNPTEESMVFLKKEGLDNWAYQLKEAGINWLLDPFSRCLKCNAKLKKCAHPPKAEEGIPPHIQEFWSCPICGGIFWLGSHTERMEEQMRKWNGSDK